MRSDAGPPVVRRLGVSNDGAKKSRPFLLEDVMSKECPARTAFEVMLEPTCLFWRREAERAPFVRRRPIFPFQVQTAKTERA
jgi:hypothetical protein